MTKNQQAKPSNYFTKDHEQAIIDYVKTNDPRERTRLYGTYIEPAFREMVDKIVFTYKFTSLPNIESLREDCRIFLVTILEKYNANSGSKAFSYFSVITKNWFIHKVKKNTEQNRREIDLQELINVTEHESLIVHNPYHEQREKAEFWSAFWNEISCWEQLELKQNEKRVLEAIKIILKEPDAIEIFNKKAVYFYIREITGLNTKQVVNNLNRIRSRYRIFKSTWNETNI